jgi:hypothetical protein
MMGFGQVAMITFNPQLLIKSYQVVGTKIVHFYSFNQPKISFTDNVHSSKPVSIGKGSESLLFTR